ncbi:MAG: hypothetical protein ACPGVU_04695 [Limisphaerales bacterium]
MDEPDPISPVPTPARRAVPRSVRMIQASIDAHRYGILSLIPFIGLSAGPVAFYRYVQSRLLRGLRRNPGGWHALAGGILGIIGFQASVFWIALIAGMFNR